jgi:hypothetical protein
MRLTPWMTIVLVVAAVAFVAVALLDEAAPASCSSADSSRHEHLLAQAEKGYVAILADEPDSGCAARGMRELTGLLCARGDQLARNGRKAEAEKVYAAVLTKEPPSGHKCAAAGLATIKDPP